jgi:hypothetical protein
MRLFFFRSFQNILCFRQRYGFMIALMAQNEQSHHLAFYPFELLANLNCYYNLYEIASAHICLHLSLP